VQKIVNYGMAKNIMPRRENEFIRNYPRENREIGKMIDIIKASLLKEKLDEIDNEVIEIVKDGWYKSHLKKNIGMWEKGDIIDGTFRGVKVPPSYRELERQTGRAHHHLKRWHDIYKQHPNKQKYIEEYAKPMATKALERYFNTIAVLQSGTPEWWTPKKYVHAVHKVMGDIDLDPASCEEANKIVMAKRFYGPGDNGLLKKWEGRIFLNPPYGDFTRDFVEKFFNDFDSSFNEGIILVNSRATDADWFQPMFEGIICFTDHRIDFDSPDEKKTSSTHGSCFVYFGSNREKFAEVFNEFGNIIKRWP